MVFDPGPIQISDYISDINRLIISLNQSKSTSIPLVRVPQGASEMLSVFNQTVQGLNSALGVSIPLFNVPQDPSAFISLINTLSILGGAGASSGPVSALRQVATRSNTLNQVNAGNKQMMNRTRHIAKVAISSLQVYFANWIITPNTGVEVGSGGTAVLTASIEFPAGTFTQLKFSGSPSSAAIANGGFVLTDTANVSIPAGAFFFVRSFYTGSAGIAFLSSFGTGGVSDLGNGEAINFGASGIADQTMGGTVTDIGAATAIYPPCAIVAQTTAPSVFIFGDSRAQGIQDAYDNINPTSLGEIARAVGQNFGYINLSANGTTMNGWLGSHANQLGLAQYCSHVICEFGINDASAGRTAAQILADRQSAAALFPGKPFFNTTLPPRTTSSDSFATLANQTLDANNGVRVAFNDAVRLGVPWATGFFDIASIVESSLDSGKWSVNGTAGFSTIDGIHETPAANNLIASSGIIPPSAIHM